jgi:NAD-dependent dihydropyrimidine dehydrogenase PreA subunit
MVGLGGWVGNKASEPLSRADRSVFTAEQILEEQANPNLEPTLYTKTFRTMGEPEKDLIDRAVATQSSFGLAGWILGGFIGLVFGLKLISLSTSRHRKDYEADKTHCFSCGRCYPYCPSDDMHKLNFLEV